MNHLAHFWLADADPMHRLGVALGDFWRGPVPADWPSALREGLIWHRRVDTLTDSHVDVVATRSRFEPPFRRYAGILLDVWFDHTLARHFGTQTGLDLDTFSARYLGDLEGAMTEVDAWMPWPAHFRSFVTWLRVEEVLPSYASAQTIERTLGGIGRRLRRDNPLHEAWPVLVERSGELDTVAKQVLGDLWRAGQDGGKPPPSQKLGNF